MLLAPHDGRFITFRYLTAASQWLASHSFFPFSPISFADYHLTLISTGLSEPFMTHLSVSFEVGVLLASPYILYQLLCFLFPALYRQERTLAIRLGVACLLLFWAGVALAYFLLAPLSFRFLGTYQLNGAVQNCVTVESYFSTLTSLAFAMGWVAQLPVAALLLARSGVLRSTMMQRYERHAFVLLLVLAAVLTPPDIFTQLLVAFPLFLLYQLCILLARHEERRHPV